MIRYRCSHCAALLAAHERRAGQSSVCKGCLTPHQIPADRALWLSESGEPLHPPAAAPAAPAAAEPPVEVASPVPAVAEPADEIAALLAPTVPDLQLPEPNAAPVVAAPPPAARPPQSGSLALPARAVLTGSLPPPPDSGHAPRTEPAGPPAAAPPRAVGPRPVPVGEGRAEPVQAQTQADIAVALTAALASRMKPAPAPRRDLRPSTAVWIFATGAGLLLLFLTLLVDPRYLAGVLLVGVAQQMAGYAWIVYLAGARDRRRGLLCAVPPATFYFLFQYKYAKWRPLRFYATGVLLTLPAALILQNPALARHTRSLVRRNDPPPPASQTDPAAMPKLAQLRYYGDRKDYDSLVNVLDVLAKTDPLLSDDAKDRAALSAELKALCQHPLTYVKVRAMGAYARWDPEGAREVCLAAVRSPTHAERQKALELLPQWKDEKTARAVQSLIGAPGTPETNQAKAALEEIGGPAAEQAAIALLNRADNQVTKLTALSILAKVGGPQTAASLRNYAMAADDATVRAEALSAAGAIETRVRPPAP